VNDIDSLALELLGAFKDFHGEEGLNLPR